MQKYRYIVASGATNPITVKTGAGQFRDTKHPTVAHFLEIEEAGGDGFVPFQSIGQGDGCIALSIHGPPAFCDLGFRIPFSIP